MRASITHPTSDVTEVRAYLLGAITYVRFGNVKHRIVLGYARPNPHYLTAYPVFGTVEVLEF